MPIDPLGSIRTKELKFTNGCQPLEQDDSQCAADGPEAVGAVADGVAEGEILVEGEDGDDGGGESDGPGRGKEHDGDDDGDENECGEDARAGHGKEG